MNEKMTKQSDFDQGKRAKVLERVKDLNDKGSLCAT